MCTVQVTKTPFVSEGADCYSAIEEETKTQRDYNTSKDINLFRQLLLAQLVQRVEFPAEDNVFLEPAGRQFHPDDDLPVGNHHGDGSEEDLEIFRQLLSPGVSGIHREEHSELDVHGNGVAITGNHYSCLPKQRDRTCVPEDETGPPLLPGLQHDVDLLGGHREHGQLDPVELVEASPGSGLRQALRTQAYLCFGAEVVRSHLENSPKSPEIHLVRTVEHHHQFSQGPSHVFGRLRLAGTGRSRWGTPHVHP